MVSHIYLVVLGALATTANAKTALLLIDVQDCFLDFNTTNGKPGSLSVPSSHIIPLINSIRNDKSCLFDEVIRSQDFHPDKHVSFGSTHGLAPFAHLGRLGLLPLKCIKPVSGATIDASCCPSYYLNDHSRTDCDKVLCPPEDWDYSINMSSIISGNAACTTCKTKPADCIDSTQAMLTDHCVQTGDATFPPSLVKKSTDIIVQKGTNLYVDAYSTFMDKTQNLMTELDNTLQAKGITHLFIAGIATDGCVYATVKDALMSTKTGKYEVTVIKDATAGDHSDTSDAAMKGFGATIVNTVDVLKMACPEVKGAGFSASKACITLLCVVIGAVFVKALSAEALPIANFGMVQTAENVPAPTWAPTLGATPLPTTVFGTAPSCEGMPTFETLPSVSPPSNISLPTFAGSLSAVAYSQPAATLGSSPLPPATLNSFGESVFSSMCVGDSDSERGSPLTVTDRFASFTAKDSLKEDCIALLREGNQRSLIQAIIDWLRDNPAAGRVELEAKQRELAGIVQARRAEADKLVQKKAEVESSIAEKKAQLSKAMEEAKNAGDAGNTEAIAELEKEPADLKDEGKNIDGAFLKVASADQLVTKKAEVESSIAEKEAELSKAMEQAKNAADGGDTKAIAKLQKELADMKKEVESIDEAIHK